MDDDVHPTIWLKYIQLRVDKKDTSFQAGYLKIDPTDVLIDNKKTELMATVFDWPLGQMALALILPPQSPDFF